MPAIEEIDYTRQHSGDPTVEALGGYNASVARVTFDGIVAYGEAKRNKGERRDADVGMDIAIGRAFIDLGEGFLQRGLDRLDDLNAQA